MAATTAYSHASRTLDGDEEAPLSFSLDNDATLEAVLVALFARHHFGEGWAADLVVPMGAVSLTSSNGEARRASGLGDIELGGRYDFAGIWGGGGFSPSVTLRLGVGLPTGERTTLGIGTSVAPTTLSIGTGAFSALGELRYTQFLHPRVAVALPLSLRHPINRIETGTSVAPTTSVGVELLGLPTDWLVLRAGLIHTHRGHDHNDENGTLLNSGGDWVRARINTAFRIGPLTLGIGGGVPLYADVNGRQISETFSLDATVALTFGAGDDEHEHDDEHGHDDHGHDDHDHAEAPSGDFRDVAIGGESFDPSAVVKTGRITVIDFWATWCHSCEHIEHALRELAAEHDELTVLRAEVPDLDAPIVDAHLGGLIALPTVWIYDTSGERVHALEGTNEDAVRRALDALLGD